MLDYNSQLTLTACDLRQKNRMTLVEKNKNLSLTALMKICLIVFPKSHYYPNPKIEPPNPKNTNQNPKKTTPFQVLHP